jgi:hypothetical protein
MPYRIRLSLYNSAGERVMDLWEGAAQYGPSQLELTDSTLASGVGAIGFVFQGALEGLGHGPQTTLYWRGQNNAAQLVGGGSYYAKLEVQDSYGDVKAMIAPISVLRVSQRQSLTVYNSAGEAVARLMADGVPGSRLAVKEASQALEQDPGSGVVSGGFEIELHNPNGTVSTLLWQGLNDQGQLVAPGSYTIELVSEQAGAPLERQSKQVVLLRAPGRTGLAAALVAPQPWRDGPLWVLYEPLPTGDALQARVYNVASELVLSAWAPGEAGRLALTEAPKLASGIYLIELTWTRGRAILERRALKLAVAR